MRASSLRFAATAVVLLAGGATACAVGTRQSPPAGDIAPRDEQAVVAKADRLREAHDSIVAQRIADQVGPRVRVRADFASYSGSRRVDATFHMYDDAYVIVGHLAADGRMRIVFPSSPKDDGFVEGDKQYRVPEFFAGFTDDFRWHWAYDRNRTVDAQRDSYDGGTGYIFVIASWRPMRLDRISDGNRWESYDVSEISYMSDPREAVEELASLLAGDNPEAYTVEYAHYTTSNFGTLSLASLMRCPMGSGYARGYSLFDDVLFPGFGFMPFSPLGYQYDPCGTSYGYQYAYGLGYFGYPYGIYQVGYVPPRFVPTRPTPGTPGVGGSPVIGHRPGHPTDTAGAIPSRPKAKGTDGGAESAPAVQYRRRGLIVEDAGPKPGHDAAPGRWQTLGTLGGGSEPARPSIQEMLQRRRTEMQNGGRAGPYPGWRGSADEGWSSGISTAHPHGTRAETGAGDASGGYDRPRPSAGGERGAARAAGGTTRTAPSYTPRAEPRGEPRSAPQPMRAEPSHSAPPPRAEPAPRPSSGSEKHPSR